MGATTGVSSTASLVDVSMVVGASSDMSKAVRVLVSKEAGAKALTVVPKVAVRTMVSFMMMVVVVVKMDLVEVDGNNQKTKSDNEFPRIVLKKHSDCPSMSHTHKLSMVRRSIAPE